MGEAETAGTLRVMASFSGVLCWGAASSTAETFANAAWGWVSSTGIDFLDLSDVFLWWLLIESDQTNRCVLHQSPCSPFVES